MKKPAASWRINIILVLIFMFGAAVISRLFFLQILERKLFEAEALGQQSSFNNITGSRGQIFCEDSQQTKGNQGTNEIKSLAINKDSWQISVNPTTISDKNSFAETLSKNINQTKDQILSELNGGGSYVVLAKGLSSDNLAKIKTLGLKGLSWQDNPERFYPQGDLAAEVLGFLGGQGTGQYGVEGYYDDLLAGKSRCRF